mgnify:CR=1 FL=1
MEILNFIFHSLLWIFYILLAIWILYDIINFIVKRLSYKVVEAETCQPVRARVQEAKEATTYYIKVKYMYDNKLCFFTTRWGVNVLIPKEGKKRKIYINKTDSSKVYYIEPKLFVANILFRLVFFIPLIR